MTAQRVTVTRGGQRVAIKPCPASGEGVHRWVYYAYHWLREAGRTREEAAAWIKEHATREVPDREIPAEGSKPDAPAAKKWPKANREQIEAVAASGLGVAELREVSPVRLPEAPATREILAGLFPADCLVCAGGDKDMAKTTPLAALLAFKDISLLQFIVPSPMRAAWGRNKDGERSARCLDNTGPRRFVVVEGDMLGGEPIPKDTQAAVLLHLADEAAPIHAPLALVVDSGGKSLHGWFYCAGKTDEQIAPFFRLACALGADPGLWTRSQFARMPDGTRDNGTRQRILYFNPEVLK